MEASPGADTALYAGSEGNDNGFGVRGVFHGPDSSHPIETHYYFDEQIQKIQQLIDTRWLYNISPPADTVFWKKPGAGPSARKRSLFPDGFGHRVSKNDVCFLAEGAEIGFLCCPVWQGKLLKTQIITFADR